jgi:acyl-CoA hydrolase
MIEPRPVRDSVTEYSEFALPNDANPLGHILGGKVMHLVDIAGAMAAMRHARRPVVTASVDQMTFLHPVHIGQLVILRSSVNRVFRTSMEVGVKVFMEDLTTGAQKHTSSAYVTFVAVDEAGRPAELPPVTKSGASKRPDAAASTGSNKGTAPAPALARAPCVGLERALPAAVSCRRPSAARP